MDVKIYVGLVLSSSGYCAIVPEFNEAIELDHSFLNAVSYCSDNLVAMSEARNTTLARHPVIVVKTATLNYLRTNGLPRDRFIDIIEITINR